MSMLTEKISQKEHPEMIENNATSSTRSSPSNSRNLLGTVKEVFNYVIGNKKEDEIDLKEVEELKTLLSELEIVMRALKQKTINFKNKCLSKYFDISGKLLGVYCIYRIVMTSKNYLFQRYSDINVMLREELLNIVDWTLDISFRILKWDVEEIIYTVIEQYFSLFIVGTIIIVNVRSFLNTIRFIYMWVFKKSNTRINKKVQLLFLSYFVGLFYVTSSIFLIFNLPITYRYIYINMC